MRKLLSRAVPLFCISAFILSASAAEPLPRKPRPTPARSGLSAAFEAHRETNDQLQNGALNRVARKSLDILVAEGVKALREVNEFELAAQFEQEWKNQVSFYLNDNSATAIGILELGDFNPISPWLANFYENLYQKTRGSIKGVRMLRDIDSLNYALAVTLNPRGKWRSRSAYDRIEYRKHFVPFARISTYWVSKYACEYYVQDFDKICGYAADMLEFVMARYIAPPTSDRIFAMATRGEKSWQTFNSVRSPLESFEQFETEMSKRFNLASEE